MFHILDQEDKQAEEMKPPPTADTLSGPLSSTSDSPPKGSHIPEFSETVFASTCLCVLLGRVCNNVLHVTIYFIIYNKLYKYPIILLMQREFFSDSCEHNKLVFTMYLEISAK